ncbi:MAG: alanine--glyoxylate aminotransferase family protein [Phycisphaerales bacterium]|jgi:serine---pyruvate transaminase|nr:alanine--glyoxylate aminotransferase family protein [Phycisphaerales bacterium]MBT7171720.1 alanine--glyoxylate aminotransferase family protein [Phycisphaerales bacterium]
MLKKRLLTPGPTDVAPEVLIEMAKPIFHHRTPQFREMFGRVQEGLKAVYRTKDPVVVMSGSGTAGMEAAIVCACPRDKKVLVANSGKFGERWAKVARAYGLDVDEVITEWGTPITPEVVAEKVATGEYGAVIVVYSETSTATACDVKAIAEIIKPTDTLLLCDAITACGTLPLETDAWGVDVVASGSQKAFMLPPGLAMLSVSEKAWAVIDTIDAPAFYLNLKAYRKSLAGNDTPYTSAVSLIRGLEIALDMLNEVGIEKTWTRTALLAKALREAAKVMGMTVASQSPSDSVTALFLPEGIDDTIRKVLKNSYGVSVAGGQDGWKNRVIRISHMGYVDPFDTLTVVAALEYALRDLGQDIEIGAAVAVAAKVLADWK